MIMIKNKDSNPEVRDKLKNLITTWAIKFKDCQDILPGFTQMYNSLKASGVHFDRNLPEHSDV